MNPVATFTQKIIETYKSGHATEHSYRPALQELFEKITELVVHNEPRRSEFGAPDFVFTKGKTVIAYAEAKDIHVSLNEIEKSEQMARYYGYSNIILTNGLDFRFYRNATSYGSPIIIGKLNKEGIEIFQDQFQLLVDTIGGFIKESKEPIKSGTVLSKVMEGKARRIRDNVKKFLEEGKNPKNENLLDVYEVIKKLLVADLDYAKFADMYAQTLVYGLFVARFNDTTQENFTRQEARDLIPPSNPFLREFFNHIAGSSFDERIEYIVNELCEEFNHADVREIIHKYYKLDLFGKVHESKSKDPIIHFYEDFLQEYDPVERKKMGVFYTPLPVVRFIVRAVDDMLKKEFSLPQGLADNAKIDVIKEIQDKRHTVPVHKVQVLDPATGTGTFLNEVILHIKKSFEGQEGRWSSYVNADLIPRMHGFELMMASYTIAHLKLSSTIAESGAKVENARLGVYLTNSLEKAETGDDSLFAGIGLGKAITEESNQANRVKNELPIMVVMGNPPYSVSSQNKGGWIQDLIKEYKKDLNERKINLDDDYIKFIRLSESLIEKNGSGMIAMITNNSFIDGITHRQMRKHLLETFDSIYIVDLHGNAKKKEKAPDGGADENVFNIMQGVSINIFVKKEGKKKGLGTVFHTDLYGKREDKFKVLDSGNMENIKWNKLKYAEPYYFFVPKDFSENVEYEKGFKVDELFPISNSGVKTDRDALFIDMDKSVLEKRMHKLLSGDYNSDFKKDYRVIDSGSYKFTEKLKNKHFDFNNIQPVQYRPFENQFIYYDSTIISRPGFSVFKHINKEENLVLCTSRSIPQNQEFNRVFASGDIIDIHFISDQTYAFPLYLYAEDGSRVPNFNREIVDEIGRGLRLEATPSEGRADRRGRSLDEALTPENIFDYIYAVLHSPSYREKYKEFLKIDFPRVPYPKDLEIFEKLVVFGKELRELHLLELPKVNKFISTFPEAGSDAVDAKYPKYKEGRVYINEKQYFGSVPEVAWNFYIGGYQPAQKWLKDRQGRVLSNQDIEHYQKMIVALVETERIMGEVDRVLK